jgi:hypothetical protein
VAGDLSQPLLEGAVVLPAGQFRFRSRHGCLYSNPDSERLMGELQWRGVISVKLIEQARQRG